MREVWIEWIEKTKEELKEKERLEKVKEKFCEEFNCEPQKIFFENGRATAVSLFLFEEEMKVEDYTVSCVQFKVQESSFLSASENDYSFNFYEEEEGYVIYKFFNYKKEKNKFIYTVNIRAIAAQPGP